MNAQELFAKVQFFVQQYLDLHSFLVPLGIIGFWRWGVWLLKEIAALFYRPKKSPYKAKVSVVTPVYNEDPKVFKEAIYSWQRNNPEEIIAVIDHTDQACIAIFQEFQKVFVKARMIITHTPGKRPALADGIKASKSEIVALVDSDTIWEDSTLVNGLPPFINPKVAGVATYQSVIGPKTIAQKIFDTQLDLRYCDDFAFLAATGDALVCLSGRTAFYRRIVLLPLLDDLVNETFLGKPVISGDDKRLTYLLLAQGWKLAYQSSSRVYTPGMESMRAFLKQRIRWARNSLRADLRALLEGWSFRYPSLAFFQIDKIFQTFTVIISPIYFTISILLGLWLPAGVIAVWWFVSRTIKMFPHLRRRPQDIVILPLFVLFSFLSGIIKIYAFYTLNTQGWITRWDASRLPKFRFIQSAPAYIATIGTLLLLYQGIYYYQQQVYFLPLAKKQQHIADVLANQSIQPTDIRSDSGLSIPENSLLVTKYIVQDGDTISNIAVRFGIGSDELLNANISRLPNWNRLDPGFVLSIPGKDTRLNPPPNFNYQRIYQDPKRIIFNQGTNTIDIFGRGQVVDLAQINQAVGEDHLKEVSPGEWLLSSNIFLHSGTTLNLTNKEVKWLKMQSNKNGFVTLLAYNSILNVDGVKITSWDEDNNNFDGDLTDGRSYILAKDGSRMDLYNSELSYLGYPRPADGTTSTYGVSWRMSNGRRGTALLTGEVLNSNFHHNYFGAYTFGATGITWRGNKFHDNIRYGLDPHDDSNGFLVENNLVYNNGSHGIIFSKRCVNNIIRGNISYNNKLHGIMLHEKSDHNVIENNTLTNNNDGIALWNSKNNLISNNKIFDNKNGIRANVTSNWNSMSANTISGTKQYGIYLYGQAANNTISSNHIINNENAVYIKSTDNVVNGNVIKQNKTGVYLTGEAAGNNILSNEITYNSKYGIYSKTMPNQRNFINGNDLFRNRRDLFAT